MTCVRDARPFELGPVGGSGPALLCLHGLTGSPYEVRPPAPLYEEHGIACVGPRLPGHESVERLARTSRREWVEYVLAAYDRLARTHSRVYALGLSLGGVLALRLGEEREVAGLLLLAAPIDLGRWYRTLIPIVSRVVSSVAKTPAIVDPEARDAHPGLRRMPLRSVVELMRLQREVEGRLDRVRAPLRLLYSRRDPTVAVGDAQRIVRGATQTRGEIEYLERSGHVITVDLESDQVERWIVGSLLELEKRCG